MLEFIFVPVIVGICVAGVYGLFELFARRKERLLIIEKLGDKLDTVPVKFNFPSSFPRFSFSALKGGCLLAGIGLGLLVGFIINTILWSSGYFSALENNDHYNRAFNSIGEVAYGASVLLFGGISLIIAFIIELKMNKKNENK